MVQVSYSTAGFGRVELGPALDSLRSAGFQSVELACDRHASGDHPSQFTDDIRRQLQDRGMTASTVHAPARRVVLGAPDEEWRQESVKTLSDAVRFTGGIGAKGIVIHGIPNPMFLPQDCEMKSLYAKMVDAMRRSVEELVPVAAEAGVRLLLENLPYNRDFRIAEKEADYPLMHMADLREFVEDFPPQQVALIIDVGHSWTNRMDPATEILAAGDRLWGTHIQDVDFDDPCDNHWTPTQGGLDWPSILSALSEVKYSGTYTFEVIMPRHDETADELATMTFAVAQAWGLV